MRARKAAFGAVLALAFSVLVPLTASAAPAPPGSGSAEPAKPAPQYAAEVLVLHATNGDKGIDPRIGDMPELRKPPFSSYKSYELLERVKLPLKAGDSKTHELPNGRILQAKLLEVLPADTVRLTASIDDPRGKKEFLPLLEVKAKVGQSFIVAGQSYKSGILVLVIRVSR